jgi:pimeloyl-ACP methyl ester carboxylesterase
LGLQTVIYFLGGFVGLYLLFSLICTYFVQQLPRNPVSDPPDWGRLTDTKIRAIDGGLLEVWRIEPPDASRGLVIFAHGWGRNRDRMVSRARIFARWGFTAIIHSARDHGGSSRRRFMNAVKFAEDIEAVLNWLGEPVILYGHSAGSAGAIIAASRNPNRVQVLLLEASYAYTKEALLSLYRWFNSFFGICVGPMIVFWMNLFYRNKLDSVSPARLAPVIKIPVMLIHGEKDRRFPLEFALNLKRSFAPGQVELYVGEGAGHSDSSLTSGYEGAVKSFLDRHLSNN